MQPVNLLKIKLKDNLLNSKITILIETPITVPEEELIKFEKDLKTQFPGINEKIEFLNSYGEKEVYFEAIKNNDLYEMVEDQASFFINNYLKTPAEINSVQNINGSIDLVKLNQKFENLNLNKNIISELNKFNSFDINDVD
jgi:hypothetical protein